MKFPYHLSILTIAISATMLTGCGKEEEKKTSAASFQTTASTTAATSTPNIDSKSKSAIEWSSLNETQKAVLSIAEIVWPTIPAEKQKSFMEAADKWTSTSPDDQRKVLDDLRTYVKP
jgi:hypothetical protein